MGLDKALNPELEPDATLVASAALGAAEVGADRVLSVLAALVSAAPAELVKWLDELGLTRDGARRDRVRARRRADARPALAEGPAGGDVVAVGDPCAAALGAARGAGAWRSRWGAPPEPIMGLGDVAAARAAGHHGRRT